MGIRMVEGTNTTLGGSVVALPHISQADDRTLKSLTLMKLAELR